MRFLDIKISPGDGDCDALSYYPSKLVNLGVVTEYMAVDMTMVEEL